MPSPFTVSEFTAISMLPRILDAARLLHECGLTDEAPSSYVKRYVQAHPEINQALNRRQPDPVEHEHGDCAAGN